jgi:hypothetical protein
MLSPTYTVNSINGAENTVCQRQACLFQREYGSEWYERGVATFGRSLIVLMMCTSALVMADTIHPMHQTDIEASPQQITDASRAEIDDQVVTSAPHGDKTEHLSRESRMAVDDAMFYASKSRTWTEVWGAHADLGRDSAINYINPRIYHTFAIGRSGAQGVTRLDTFINSVSGPEFKNAFGSGQFNPGQTRFTLAGYSPEVLKDLTLGSGFRLFIPSGYNKPPYSPSQWAIGPQLGMTYNPKNLGSFTFFSPTVRYTMGFTPEDKGIKLTRVLEMYPALGFQLSEKVKLAMWNEEGVWMNAQTGKWFVPADAMLTYSFNKHWGATIGGVLPIINDYFRYNWATYGRLTYMF